MVQNYDLDGVMHDDRLAWPREFGWDQTTKNIYLAETGNTLSNNPSSSQLNQFMVKERYSRFQPPGHGHIIHPLYRIIRD